MIDPGIFVHFKEGEKYLLAAEAARLLDIDRATFLNMFADQLEFIPLPHKRRRRDSRLFALSSIEAYKKQRNALFKPDANYLSHHKAAAYLGLSLSRLAQLRDEGQIEAVYLPASRQRWWYPQPSLDARVPKKGGRKKTKKQLYGEK